MRATVLSVLILVSATTAGSAVPVPNDERTIVHALNRLAFGAGPGEIDEVKRIGLSTWIDRQLQPHRIPDTAVEEKLRRLTTLGLDSATLARDYIRPAREERRRRQQMNPPAESGAPGNIQGPGAPRSEAEQRGRQVFSDLTEAKLLRAVYSERQLQEVLVDFWFNHFNVFARKGQTEVYITAYERDVIRPHVLGTFRELLEATAKSPAMLFYLDNWMSADPNAAPARRGRVQQQPKRSNGLNENYARELLELHTLGVDGGYTQQDVVEVARALTGWTIDPPQRGGLGFRFAAAMHDRGEKRVLGHIIPASAPGATAGRPSGGGMEDGERVLDIVASHPSTAKHIAFKLAQRFVSDTPPVALVDRAAARFRDTKGDLREVVRAIITSPEFFAPAAYQAKVKTPFEFVASALRAAGAEVSSGVPVARALAAMGMPLYLCQPPTGYDETAETWISAGALVNRLNFAVELAGNRMRGVRLPAQANADLGKLIGSPEFQKQ